MGNGFDIFKYKDKLDKERAEREAKYGKPNTIGMKLVRSLMYAVSGTMIWSLSTTFLLPQVVQMVINVLLFCGVAFLTYKAFKAPSNLLKR